MTKTRSKLLQFAEEENLRDGAGQAPVEAVVPVVKGTRGRPKTKPESKLVSFHLSLDLIQRIDDAANETMAGNKSALVGKILGDYFAKK